MEEIKRAIIIAAGEGSRMRPVTLETPKPLVNVNGTRIVDTSIAALKKNGIHDIIIVVGYLKEKFHEAYDKDPDIRIIENDHYKDGNNVTSMYVARKYLPQSFIVEGDLVVKDETIFGREIEKSSYFAPHMDVVPEWSMKLENGRIVSCDVKGGKDGYRNVGISMWTKKDGELLANLIEKQIEEKKDWNIYWDQIPLFLNIEDFNLGVREISEDALTEIDTVEELADMDSKYKKYL